MRERLLLFPVLLTCGGLSVTNGQSLAELRWKKRVVVVSAGAGAEETLAKQKDIFRERDAEFRERDVAQILLRKPADHPEIAERFKLTGSSFAVLLLGKDGLEKFRSDEPVQAETLFRLIDSMPMRQEEQRSRERRKEDLP
ncbi:MAG: DUF4174 domain-containing protein [Chthoniobacterales bacterium]|nr:DUF4174 domain-containing protein [Chthoniobacterales bacterium]